MIFYWKLQHIRLKRWLIHFGINPNLACIIIPILLIGIIKLLHSKTEYAGHLVSLIYFMLVSPLSQSDRNAFLKYTYNSEQHIKIRLAENMSVGVLFAITMFFCKYGILSSFPLLIGVVLSFYNQAGKLNLEIPTPFSKFPFEFTVGFRQYFIVLVLQLILISIGISVDNYNLSIVTYCSIFFLMMSFFNRMEEYFFLWTNTNTATSFINKKIKIGTAYSLMLTIIPLITLSIIYPSKIWISILVTFIGVLYVIFAIVLKYAQYPLDFNLLNIIVTFISIGFPFFMIITIPYYYKKAIENLKLELL